VARHLGPVLGLPGLEPRCDAAAVDPARRARHVRLAVGGRLGLTPLLPVRVHTGPFHRLRLAPHLVVETRAVLVTATFHRRPPFPAPLPGQAEDMCVFARRPCGKTCPMRTKTVVVTGASGGVGRAIAKAFGARGANVALLARGAAG